MILFGSSFSPFVRKTMVALAEKGLDFEMRAAGLGSTDPDFLRASPFGKMPAFMDGDFAISDSTAIITYLDAKHPEPPLLPTEPGARAQAIWFEEFADTIVGPVVGKCFFNRIVAPRFLGREGDEAAAVEGETKDLPKLLDYLEGVVPEPQGFLAGTALSVGDISVASVFVNLRHVCKATDWKRWPRADAWLNAQHGRPSLAPIIAKESAILSKA